jgi:hypothetical protein
MFWRALLLCISLFVVCLVVDLSSHKDFASATIHSSVDSNCFIKCDGIEFGKNDTHVSVRLTDKNRLPQFQTFRGNYPAAFQAGDRKLSLETDLPYLKPDQVLLALSLLAYNLGNLWRRLTLPKRIENWSLTSLQQRLVKTGGRLVKHARYYWLLLAESHLTKRLFGSMLRRIAGLSLPAG